MCDYDEIYKSICRLCLLRNSDKEMIYLIDNTNEHGLSSFGQAVNIVTNVKLSKDDNLPHMACFRCVYLLKQTIYFKLMCESNDHKLKRINNFDVTNGLSTRNIKEKLSEYVLFSNYFSNEVSSQPLLKNPKVKNGMHVQNGEHKIAQSTKTSYDTEFKANIKNDKYKIICDFQEFFNNDNTTEPATDQPDEVSDENNSILDSIQYIIDSGAHVQIIKKKKTKRKERKYRTCFQRRYINKNNKERNLICNICHKTLANRLTYDHHMQRHSLCRFICDQCGKGFPVLAEMHMHQVARHGIGPYLKCDHCSYKAPRKINLIEHLRIHTGERPFTCEKCGLTFRRRAIWRNHLLRHMEKKYQCMHCPRKFFTHSQMLSHCNNVHERVYMYMCKVCSVTYTKTETVRRHMAVKHGIPREKQGKIVRISKGSNVFNTRVS